MHEDLSLLPANAVDPAPLHQAFGEAFADYLIGPFQIDLAHWPQFLARQAVDLEQSRVALRAGQIEAFALVAPRPSLGRWRLATMGAVPAARGSGAAPRLLDDFITRAAEAGLGGVELEVFAQNERALRLYRGRGFEALHELHGYVLAPGEDAAPAAPDVQPVDRAEALSWLDEAVARVPDLPLQVTSPVVGAHPAAWQAWRRGSAQLVFVEAEPLAILSLVDRDPAQRDALALLRALRARHPRPTLKVPQLQRLDVGGQALRQAGFAVQPLHQLLMLKRL